MTESEAFAQFDENLKLSSEEREAAQLAHHEIREVLQRQGVITGAFLQGSFCRKTMISPLRDIDMVVLLSAHYAHLRNDPFGPDQAMAIIENALRPEYLDANFERSRHALKIDFGEENFSFDIVPAFEIDDGSGDVDIADRDQQRWETSNTRELIAAVSNRNQQCNGRFVHQVRMIKHWAKRTMGGRLPGLVTESIAYHQVATALGHPQAAHLIFDGGASMLGGSIPDPTGRDDLSLKLNPALVTEAQAAFQDAERRAAEARELADGGDHDNANRIWHSLFGEEFPEPPAQSVDEAFDSLVGGSVTSAGTVSANPRGRQPAPPTRSWRSS